MGRYLSLISCFTVLCISVGPRPHCLETRVSIKIDPSLLPKNLWLLFMGVKAKKHKKCIFCLFWVTLMPFTSIYPTDPRTNPTHFHKKLWELIVLKNLVILSRSFWIFFSKKFFLLNPMISSQRFLVSKDGSNFWWLPWLLVNEVLGQHLCTGL